MSNHDWPGDPEIEETPLEKFLTRKKNYAVQIVCINCGDRSYYSFPKGTLIKGTWKACKKCGCTLGQTK